MVFSLFTSTVFSYNTYEVFGIVRRHVYHNDRGGYVSSRDVCLLATYSKPENRTRSLTLVRLAVNLGLHGPA
jgi:hypothetical protein